MELACVLSAALTGFLIIWKHRINIKRLMNGEEIGLRKANSGQYRKSEEKNENENI